MFLPMRNVPPENLLRQNGFTLIELLVVISIIAVLSVVGMVVFTGVQKNARDARRKADIDSIANALEAHYNNCTVNNGPYCPLLSSWSYRVWTHIFT